MLNIGLCYYGMGTEVILISHSVCKREFKSKLGKGGVCFSYRRLGLQWRWAGLRRRQVHPEGAVSTRVLLLLTQSSWESACVPAPAASELHTFHVASEAHLERQRGFCDGTHWKCSQPWRICFPQPAPLCCLTCLHCAPRCLKVRTFSTVNVLSFRILWFLSCCFPWPCDNWVSLCL